VYGVPFVPRQTDAFILAQCHLAGTSGRYIYGDHALDQMDRRNVTRGDVRSALGSATVATFQPDNGRWLVTGTDRSGDSLSLAAVFENGIVVITVF
jgi:hypothetical protein